ncbi:hypothetical protein IKE72_00535 [Candidatus Saccharibacteria bacterium]|nr:hypothetical protein [Candidatus Saccharibacteria bacterium]
MDQETNHGTTMDVLENKSEEAHEDHANDSFVGETPSHNNDSNISAPTEKKPVKKNKGLVAGLVVCILLALGGIAFGVYGIMQSSQKDNQISDLKVQIEDKDGTIKTLEAEKIEAINESQTVEIIDSTAEKKNPIISATPPKHYSFSFDSPVYSHGEKGMHYLRLSVSDGAIDSCAIYTQTKQWVENDTAKGFIENNKLYRECSGVNGLSGKVYKIVLASAGQDASMGNIAFIMEDGTVQYVPIKEAVESDTPTIKGKIAIDGFVTDAFTVNINEGGTGGYAATIFILSDGSYIQYSDSMLQ